MPTLEEMEKIQLDNLLTQRIELIENEKELKIQVLRTLGYISTNKDNLLDVDRKIVDAMIFLKVE